MTEYMKTKTPEYLTSALLTTAAMGINGGGGGGNVAELHSFAKELGIGKFRFFTIDQLQPDDTVCSVARLGSPGIPADLTGDQAAAAIVQGLEQYSRILNLPMPTAVAPVEATDGQLARTLRVAQAANRKGLNIGLADMDICGGEAVPAVPQAFNINNALRRRSQMVLIELNVKGVSDLAKLKIELKKLRETDLESWTKKVLGLEIEPSITIVNEPDPYKLEENMRGKAGSETNVMGAVWFAWFLANKSEIPLLYTTGSVSSTLNRGKIAEEAVRKGENPADALINAKEASYICEGTVSKKSDESSPGFAQIAYEVETEKGKVIVAARNEYIVVYNPSNKKVVARAPGIIAALSKNGPVQSHMLSEGSAVTFVGATPQCIINNPKKARDWSRIHEQYWKMQGETWKHPY